MRHCSYFALSCTLVAAASRATAEVTVIDLGPIEANAINSAGQIAGTSYPTGGNGSIPVIWNTGQLQYFDSFGGASAWGRGINSSGQIVGTVEESQMSHGFFWNGSSMNLLETFNEYEILSADGINDKSQIIGRAFDGVNYQAYVWQNGAFTSLGSLGGGHSYAFAINNVGQVAGSSTNAYGVEEAFIWENGVMQGLGSSFGGGSSYIHDINDMGVGVGWAAATGGFMWDGAATSLEPSPGGIAVPLAVNNHGIAVGTTYNPSHTERASIWVNGELTDLHDLVPGSPWHFLRVTDINDQNQIIGIGWNAGVGSAFMMTIPGPGVLAIMLIAAMMRHRRRTF